MTLNLNYEESLRPWDIIVGGIGSKQYTNVYRIASRSALEQSLQTSMEMSIRGLFKDGWVYVWDAFYATHSDFQKAFGAGPINFTLDVGLLQSELHFHTPEQYKAAFNHPVLKTVLGEHLK